MVTPSPRVSRNQSRLFSKGEKVILLNRRYVIEDCVGKGGFGEVYRVRLMDAVAGVRIAKFLRDMNDFVHGEAPHVAREISDRLWKMFGREWKTLKKMSAAYPHRFPAFYGSGYWNARPFYLMESLDPLKAEDLQRLQTDAQRMKFIDQLCQAVGALHANGLVHYDIKPANILLRAEPGEYVLGDFGSVHKEERHNPTDVKMRQALATTLSLLSDGRRITPRTIGYCDPIDSLHTKHADIYAIGQVMRDMFGDDVPALWARIILKCINRNFGLRYDSVDQVRADVLGMGGAGTEILARELTNTMSSQGAAWVRDRQVIYVSATVAKEGNGSFERPFRTIGKAISRAKSDSKIYVLPGTYAECIRLSGRRVDLIAVDGPQQTIIRGRSGNAVLRISKGADGSLVKGFTITGGTGVPRKSSYVHDYYGGGINARASATIEDCVITGNGLGRPKVDSATFGGGVCVSGATVTMFNCRVSGNFAWASGGGLMAEGEGSALVLVECTVEDNGSTDFFGTQGGIGLANQATLSVSRCVVARNQGDQIGAFGSVHANGTRAQVESSFVEGGVRACNIMMFIDRQNNLKSLPPGGTCGCRLDRARSAPEKNKECADAAR